MRHKKVAEKLLHSYNSKVAWGNADSDEALIEAIDFAFSYRSDEERADLFAMLKEHWDEYRAGIPRKLYVASVIGKWTYNILHPKREAKADE